MLRSLHGQADRTDALPCMQTPCQRLLQSGSFSRALLTSSLLFVLCDRKDAETYPAVLPTTIPLRSRAKAIEKSVEMVANNVSQELAPLEKRADMVTCAIVTVRGRTARRHDSGKRHGLLTMMS